MPDYTSNLTYTANSGTTPTSPFITHFSTVDPTPQDINYTVQQRWINTTYDREWILEGFSSFGGVVTAIWSQVSSGILGVESLTGNTGGPINPDASHNINTLGDTTTIVVAGNPATHTLTFSTGPEVAISYVEDTGTAIPALGSLNVLGTAGHITTAGAGSTITINTGADVAVEYVEDTGTAVPVSGILNVLGQAVAAGTTPVTTTGATNVVTLNVQRTQAISTTNAANVGLAAFNSANFSVDANGFVSLLGIFTINQKIFETSGIYTPSSGMTQAYIEVVGGGGGGGGGVGSSGLLMSLGAGGGGGEYSCALFTAAAIGASQAVTIGSGGAAGSSSAGGNGGTTSVGALISANGGLGGTYQNAAQADCAISGAPGGSGTVIAGVLSIPGSPGCASYGMSVPANSYANGIMGGGGSSHYGGGAPWQASGAGGGGITGVNGTVYGSGGGGGGSVGGGITTHTGGTGAAGIVIVTEYIQS
jgi:hypothetical protein